MSAIVVGFISEKGGVGKTTCCYHVAVGLKKFYKKKVLVLDTDYQRGGITCRFIPEMLEEFKKGKVSGTTLYPVFRSIYTGLDTLPVLDIVQGTYKIDLVPSDPRLSEVTIDKLPGSNNIRENNRKIFDHLAAISNALEPLKNNYDYILIDTHPEISDLLKSVIFASDFCVSPVKLDEQSSVGVPSAIEAIKQVNGDCKMLEATTGSICGKETVFAGAIAMMTRTYAESLIYSQNMQYIKLKQIGIFKNYVTEGDGVRNAAANHIAVFDEDGPNAELQSNQFKGVIKEFLQRCKK